MQTTKHNKQKQKHTLFQVFVEKTEEFLSIFWGMMPEFVFEKCLKHHWFYKFFFTFFDPPPNLEDFLRNFWWFSEDFLRKFSLTAFCNRNRNKNKKNNDKPKNTQNYYIKSQVVVQPPPHPSLLCSTFMFFLVFLLPLTSADILLPNDPIPTTSPK